MDKQKQSLSTNKQRWAKRYTTNEYEDYWTDLLDDLLNVTLASRKTILRWGSEQFENQQYYVFKLNCEDQYT